MKNKKIISELIVQDSGGLMFWVEHPGGVKIRFYSFKHGWNKVIRDEKTNSAPKEGVTS